MDGSDSTIITIFIVSALIVLVLVVTIVLFVLLYQRKMLQQQMSLQHLEVDFQKELLAATLESQEVERSRIARDLHDSVGVMLSTLQLMLKRYDRGETDPEKKGMVGKSSEIITETIATVRRISHNLLPPELELLGLRTALEQVAGEISRTGTLRVDLEVRGIEERLPVRREMLLFRIAQELLNNTLKHAEATEATMRLEEEGGEITFIYTDNGRGLPPHLLDPEGRRGGCLGLSNIESRARSLGGTLRRESSAGAGMRCELTFKRLPTEELKV